MSRLILAVMVCVVGLSHASAFAQAADADLTAAGRLDRGLAQVDAGQLEQAKATLERIDSLQLAPDQRVTLFETLRSIEDRLAAGDAGAAEAAAESPPTAPEPPSASELLSEADAMRVSQPSEAAAMYRAVLVSPTASEAEKTRASAGLIASRRLIERDLTEARQLIEAAATDLEAGRREAASAKLADARAIDADLGWFDQQRLERLTALAEAPATPEPEPVVAPAPVEPEIAPRDEPGVTEPDFEEAAAMAADEPGPAPRPAPAPTEAAEGEASSGSDLLAEARLLYAQEKAAEAEAAMADSQYRRAAQLFEEALLLDPDNPAYEAGLGAAVAAREAGPAPRGLLEDQVEARRLAAQQAKARYEAARNEAGELARREEFTAALDATGRARRILDDNERVLGREYNTLRAQITELTAQIVELEQAARQRDLALAEDARVMAEQQALAAQRAEDAREVERLLRRAWALRREMKYDEALQIVDQALFIAPNDLAAQFMKEAIEDHMRQVKARELLRRRRLGNADINLDNLEATIPSSNLVEYPEIWPRLTEQRLASLDASGGDSEVDREVRVRLRERIPADFDANRLQAAIEYVRLSTGVDIFVNWPALEAVGVEQDTPVTLTLNSAPAEEILRLVLSQASAAVGGIEPINFAIDEGVVRISTETDLRSETTIRQYDIRDLLVQVPTFENAPEFDLQDALPDSGGGTGGGGGGGGDGGLFGDDDDEEEDEDQLSRADLIDAILQLIQDTVGSPDEWINLESTIRELNGNLIVRTTVNNHRQIFELLQQLRETRAIQISVEARFLSVSDDFLEEIGVDLDIFLGGDLFGDPGDPDDSGIQIPGGIDFDQNSGGAGGIVESIIGSDGVLASAVAGAGAASSFGLTAFLDDIEVSLMVEATQASSRSISLTAPKVTFFNGQRAYVLIVTQQAFVSDLEPVADAGGFDLTVDVVEEGVVLDVEGTVSADRRYVTLTLRPSIADIIDIATFAVEGADVIDTDTDEVIEGGSGFIQLPEVALTEIRQTVSVPDQGTLLTGGQRLVDEVEVEAGVPVLSKIPVVSRFFTNTATIKSETTLLILVKPTIIIQSELEEENFPGLETSPSDFNVNRPAF